MAKQTVTQRLRKSLTQKIRRLEKQGVHTGTLRADIQQMNWRELKKLATPSKTGKSTFKGLEEYLNEEPRREYYRESDMDYQQDFEEPTIDTGYNYGMSLVELLMNFFNESIPEETEGKGGKIIQRRPEDIAESERAQSFLMDLFYAKAAEIGFSELGRQLEPHAQRISECIGKCLYGYKGDAQSAMNELATIINGGALSAQQYQEYSDFADGLMGEEMDM